MAETNDPPRPLRTLGAAVGNGTIDSSLVARLYDQHAAELRRFVLGVTRDPDLTGDVLQTTFTKAVELGHTARVETFKGWLFRVALHEVLTARRRRETREKGYRHLAWLGESTAQPPEERLIRGETVDAVRSALSRLPPEQLRVVQARMYEEKSFAEIAEEFRLPLGTVLTRMRLALEKLRRSLPSGD